MSQKTAEHVREKKLKLNQTQMFFFFCLLSLLKTSDSSFQAFDLTFLSLHVDEFIPTSNDICESEK